MPYINSLLLHDDLKSEEAYFARLPVVNSLLEKGRLNLKSPVCFIVGENGTGKSTLLEAIAICCGFNPEGGTINYNFSSRESHSGLYSHLALSRSAQRPKDGFFLRAESFYNVASEAERVAAGGLQGEHGAADFLERNYGGNLHEQSHGESFMSLILNRFKGNGLYILDEPESALSPSRQMALIRAVYNLVSNNSQFIISTHSPILMAYPDALIYEIDSDGIHSRDYKQTGHYNISKSFLNNPEQMLKHLLED